jgi:hypothetical protein
MNEKVQITQLVKDFLFYANQLLKENKIDYETYVKITQNKVEFLKKVDQYNTH